MHFVSRIVWLNLYADLFGWTCILDYLVEHVCWIIFKLLVLACPRLFLICMWYYFVAACINELYSCQSRVNWTTHTDKTQLWISECHSSWTPSTDSSSSTQSQLQLDFRSGAALPEVGAMPNGPLVEQQLQSGLGGAGALPNTPCPQLYKSQTLDEDMKHSCCIGMNNSGDLPGLRWWLVVRLGFPVIFFLQLCPSILSATITFLSYQMSINHQQSTN
jgi:hypothetical protein